MIIVHTFGRLGSPKLTRRGVLTVDPPGVSVVRAVVMDVSACRSSLLSSPLASCTLCLKLLSYRLPLSLCSCRRPRPTSFRFLLLSVFSMQSSVFVVCMSSVFSFFLKSRMLIIGEIIRHSYVSDQHSSHCLSVSKHQHLVSPSEKASDDWTWASAI